MWRKTIGKIGRNESNGEKIYYGERHDLIKPEHLDFNLLRRMFLMIYKRFEDKNYFQMATGKECTDDWRSEIGEWGTDIDAFFYQHLGLANIWPIEKNIVNFDEPIIFSIMEFLFDYVAIPLETWDHPWNYCGIHVLKADNVKGREEYSSALDPLFSDKISTTDPENIDTRFEKAVLNYRRYGATLEDKKGALLALSGILEFLKKKKITLPKQVDSDLFKIMNNFDLRHHNQLQLRDYSYEIWYDWFFLYLYCLCKDINKIAFE